MIKKAAFAFLLLTSAILYSYEEDSNNNFALLFGIEGLDSIINPHEGSTLSCRYNFNSNKAIRLGITLGFERGLDVSFYEALNTVDNERHEDLSNTLLIKPSLSYMRFFNDRIVNPYWGIGVLGAYQYTDEEVEINDNGVISNRNVSLRSFDIGVKSFLGVEIAPFDFLGFSLEYSVNLKYRYSYLEDVAATREIKEESDKIILDYDNLFLGLTIYL